MNGSGGESPSPPFRPDEPATEAVGRLFEEYGGLVYTLGRRICGDPDTADDLVQETFLRALDAWEGFEGRSKPSTWLYTIATRACSRMRRLRAGQPARMERLDRLLPSGDEGILQVPSPDDPEAEAVLGEATEAVREAIWQLPLEFRLPLVLKEVMDLSVSEVATILGVKEATVKTRLHRARLKVRASVAAALPRRDAPRPDHPREECLLLLKAKQESLDRDVPFPISDDEMCQRCRSVFASLDLTRDACRALRKGEMPAPLREAVSRALA